MKNVIIFTVGAACGSLLTWKLLEKKYKDLADEEIASVIDTFKKKDGSTGENIHHDEIVEIKENEEVVEEKEAEAISYNTIIDDLGYTVTVEQGEEGIKPYTISPEEFGEMPGYDALSWTYYADGVLTDEMDQIVDNPELTISDALNHFGEYEDDAVFVRNENNKCDYEILKNETYFSGIDS